MGGPWVRSAVVAAASHGPPRGSSWPAHSTSAPAHGPVEEEEKHQEERGREPTLSCHGAGCGLARGSFIGFWLRQSPLHCGPGRAQMGPDPHTWCLHHQHLQHDLSQAQWCMNCPDNAPVPLWVAWGAPKCHHCHQGWELLMHSSLCCEGSCGAAAE